MAVEQNLRSSDGEGTACSKGGINEGGRRDQTVAERSKGGFRGFTAEHRTNAAGAGRRVHEHGGIREGGQTSRSARTPVFTFAISLHSEPGSGESQEPTAKRRSSSSGK